MSEDNIEDQVLFVELLSLIMIDPWETPLSNCQDVVNKKLFPKSARNERERIESLLEFEIVGGQLMVRFNN